MEVIIGVVVYVIVWALVAATAKAFEFTYEDSTALSMGLVWPVTVIGFLVIALYAGFIAILRKIRTKVKSTQNARRARVVKK